MSTKKNMDSVMSKWSEYQEWRLFFFVCVYAGQRKKYWNRVHYPWGRSWYAHFFEVPGKMSWFFFFAKLLQIINGYEISKNPRWCQPCCVQCRRWMDEWMDFVRGKRDELRFADTQHSFETQVSPVNPPQYRMAAKQKLAPPRFHKSVPNAK